jgi:hypothetical protein
MFKRLNLCLVAGLLAIGCADETATSSTADSAPQMTDLGRSLPDMATADAIPMDIADAGSVYQARPGPIPATPQRPGDPERGYHALVNAPYVTCGVPARIYDQFQAPAPAHLQLPGRDGANETRAFFETEFTNEDGIQIVSTNCLTCHVGVLNNQLFVGLGNESSDFTIDTSGPAIALRALAQGDHEERALARWSQRVLAIAPHVQLDTVGVNPADNLTAALIAHRDQETLAWSEAPLLDLPSDLEVIPISVPPWWNMKKKNAMFYTAVGRGDHARFMMTASTLCTDSVEEARMIDAWFPDIRAYIASIEPPIYPYEIDEMEATKGKRIFEATCARCHGTYETDWTYPNLFVGIDDVGTDDVLARRSFNAVAPFIDWYNGSFFGELARAVPGEGYIAPPLDGVWATAPYLHNGSVPTIAQLLNSETRPRYWSRFLQDSQSYDENQLGWEHDVLEYGKDGASGSHERKRIYDTTRTGYGNGGHLYGDALTERERTALLEYLKTL